MSIFKTRGLIAIAAVMFMLLPCSGLEIVIDDFDAYWGTPPLAMKLYPYSELTSEFGGNMIYLDDWRGSPQGGNTARWYYETDGSVPTSGDPCVMQGRSEYVYQFDEPINFAAFGEDLELTFEVRPNDTQGYLYYIQFFQGGFDDAEYIVAEALLPSEEWYWPWWCGLPPIAAYIGDQPPMGYGYSEVEGCPLGEWSTVVIRAEHIFETGLCMLWPSAVDDMNAVTGILIGCFTEEEHGHREGAMEIDNIRIAGSVTYHVDGVNGNDSNDGLSREEAFLTIQKGIDAAVDGEEVLVWPAVYNESVYFLNKAITVRSAADAAIIEADSIYGVSFNVDEGKVSVLKNFVIRNSDAGIYVSTGSPTISNVTIVDNLLGIDAEEGADPCISNCILWNNGTDLWNCDAKYSCVEQGSGGLGNISYNPLFVDANGGNYRLLSEGWRWDSIAGRWTFDYATSRCIDAGNPGCPLGDELISVPGDPDNFWGVNLRINMGAYGGTSQASMAPHGWAYLGDLTNDRRVDIDDFVLFTEYWLASDECIPSDLDRDTKPDFGDYSLFAADWGKLLPCDIN